MLRSSFCIFFLLILSLSVRFAQAEPDDLYGWKIKELKSASKHLRYDEQIKVIEKAGLLNLSLAETKKLEAELLGHMQPVIDHAAGKPVKVYLVLLDAPYTIGLINENEDNSVSLFLSRGASCQISDSGFRESLRGS